MKNLKVECCLHFVVYLLKGNIKHWVLLKLLFYYINALDIEHYLSYHFHNKLNL